MADWIVEWESGETETVKTYGNKREVYRNGEKETWPEKWPDAIVSAVEVKSDLQRALTQSKPGKIHFIPNDQGFQNLGMLAGLSTPQSYQERMNDWHRKTSANYYFT